MIAGKPVVPIPLGSNWLPLLHFFEEIDHDQSEKEARIIRRESCSHPNGLDFSIAFRLSRKRYQEIFVHCENKEKTARTFFAYGLSCVVLALATMRLGVQRRSGFSSIPAFAAFGETIRSHQPSCSLA